MRLAYILVSYLIAPIIIGFLIWRGFWNRSYWERFGERFGYGETQGSAPSIWVHAVSVGEVQASAPLVRGLRNRYPEVPMVITTVTPTGSQRARDLFGDDVRISYAPYDLPGSVRRFFDRINPRVAIILETELWPNLYNECGRRGVPLVLASARISPRSVNKYRRWLGLFREALSHGIVIAAQSAADADRFRSLGASAKRTHVTGNIKFDFELTEDIPRHGETIRRRQAGSRPVWVAASTHEGEEDIIMDAHFRIARAVANPLLFLVPRHPERFEPVAALLRRRRVDYVTRSSGKNCTSKTQVFLVDTLGELPFFYAASDVAFVGGSLVPIGGHNLLEPAVLGLPILTGPHNFNAEDIVELLLNVGAARTVADSRALASELETLLADPELRRTVGVAGRRVVEENKGALDRLLALVAPLIETQD